MRVNPTATAAGEKLIHTATATSNQARQIEGEKGRGTGAIKRCQSPQRKRLKPELAATECAALVM